MVDYQALSRMGGIRGRIDFAEYCLIKVDFAGNYPMKVDFAGYCQGNFFENYPMILMKLIFIWF